MEFFNRKEEVIDIELTSHGKRMLSAGKFKPSFYAFYDDDITYDSDYGLPKDNIGQAHDRIVKTPRLKPNAVYDSVQNFFLSSFYDLITSESVNQLKESLSEPQIESILETGLTLPDYVYSLWMSYPYGDRPTDTQFTPEKKKQYVLPIPMGTSDLGNQKAPAWSVNFLKSELSSSEGTYIDGNRAIGFLNFDTETAFGGAQSLNGVTFTLTDCSSRSYVFEFNISDDPTSGTCTSNPLLICLDVTNNNSFSVTSNQIAQQVRDKINAHPILITADIPSNDGVVRLIQDAAGDRGNTLIPISAPTGDLFTSTAFLYGTEQTFSPLKIPQLYVDVTYDTSTAQGEAGGSEYIDPHMEIEYYDDGTFVKIEKDYVLLDILEKNVPYSKENFELEVYVIPDSFDQFTDFLKVTTADELRQLKFASPKRYVKFNNFLYDTILKTSFTPNIDYAEFYFDITVDEEIQKEILSINNNQSELPINDEELCEDE